MKVRRNGVAASEAPSAAIRNPRLETLEEARAIAIGHARLVELMKLPTPGAVRLGARIHRLQSKLGHKKAVELLESEGVPGVFTECYFALAVAELVGGVDLREHPILTAVRRAFKEFGVSIRCFTRTRNPAKSGSAR